MDNLGTSPSEDKFIDEITMKLLTNKTSYAKYLHKTNTEKFEEQQQFVADCKVFYKDILAMTKKMCQNENNSYGSDVNESFNNYARSIIRYLEIKQKNEDLQKEYEDSENYQEIEMFPYQAESDNENDSNETETKQSYNTGTLDMFVRKK